MGPTDKMWEVFGADVSAAEIVAAADRDGMTVAEWLRHQLHQLAEENPNGGWDAVDPTLCDTWAEDLVEAGLDGEGQE